MTELDLSRWQFAFTVIFHMTFPAVTVGMAVFLSVVYGMYWRSGRAVLLQTFRFWKRIFAVGFGLGVVAGTTITFEFGLNWGRYAAATGPVIAPIIGMEVVTAFFVEAGFIGIMLYGDGRVRQRTMFVATVFVALGTVLSTTWIMAANSWMQVPNGYRIEGGRFVPTDWWAVFFNPAFGWRYPHMLLGVLVSAAVFLGGLSAYYLLRGRALPFARQTFSIALGALAVLTPLQLMVGDNVAGHVVGQYQPTKIQAFEGDWESDNTGWNVLVIPDETAQRNLVQVTIPLLGSWINKDLSGATPDPGLLQTRPDLRPSMWTTFYGFRAMFYAGTWFFVLAAIGLVLRVRRRLFTTAWFQTLMLWTTPVGIVAIVGGWVLAETGRQPWVVYGQLRTADGVSLLATPQLVLSVVGFMLVYLALLTVFVVYVVKTVRRGPEADDPDIDGAPDEVRTSAQPDLEAAG